MKHLILTFSILLTSAPALAGPLPYPPIIVGYESWLLYQPTITPNAVLVTVPTLSRNLIIAEFADLATDWALAQSTNPTLAIQSADATAVTKRIMLYHDQTDGVIDVGSGSIRFADSVKFPSYTLRREYPITAGAIGATAPTAATNNSCIGLMFDADAETLMMPYTIPTCWTGTSDMTFTLSWCNEAGDVIADAETVEMNISYRSIVVGSETADNGTAVAVAVTYTQDEAEDADGADGDTHTSVFTLDYDSTVQPLVAGDKLLIIISRDVTTDTHSGGVIVMDATLSLTCNGLPN